MRKVSASQGASAYVGAPSMLKYCLLSLVILGCDKDPVSTLSTNNRDIQVSLLFEHDGVKVYRFSDGAKYIYYTDARGRTSWNQMEGKLSRTVGVETVDK